MIAQTLLHGVPPRALFGAAAMGAAAMAIASCSAQSGTALQITRVVGPDETCTFSASGPGIIGGFYDPTGAVAYTMVLALRNHMESRGEGQILGAATENVRPETNAAVIIGFDVCWFEYDGSTDYQQLGSEGGGGGRGCTNSSLSRYYPATGHAPPGVDPGLASVSVLRLADMQKMWGPSFNPAAIAPVGVVTITSADDAELVGSETGRAYDPGPNPADANWGNFPNPGGEVSVVVQIRALAELQSGAVMESNWLTHEVMVCPGCVANVCDVQPEVRCSVDLCPGTAGGGLCLSTGLCPDGLTGCYPGYTRFGGTAAAGTCGVHIGHSSITCAEISPCE